MAQRSVGQRSRFSALTDRFLELEAEHELFDMQVDGVYLWERLRFLVHRRILQSLGVLDQAHSSADTSKFDTIPWLFRSVTAANPLFAPSSDLLVWGHERRQQLDDGLWRDVYFDVLLDTLDRETTYLEEPHEGTHLTPTETDDVRYLDFVAHAPEFALQFVDADQFLSDADRETLGRVEALLERTFGTAPDVVDLAAEKVFRRRIRLPLFEAIVGRVDPSIALLAVSYGRETFVEACRRQGVPTVELQHGVVSQYHLGYAYPGDRTKRTFPDYLFTFGEFWSDVVDFPLPAERLFPVGYPYLEQNVDRLADVPSGEQLVFVSQGTIGAKLSQFAVEVAETRPELDIAYKLHPGEYSRWRRDYPWLVDAPLEVVDDDSLYEIFAASIAQVGVHSTALYEGLCFDLDTYLVDLPGVSYMDDLVDTGAALIVDSPDDLLDSLDHSGTARVDTERFFRPNATDNMREALAEVQRRER